MTPITPERLAEIEYDDWQTKNEQELYALRDDLCAALREAWTRNSDLLAPVRLDEREFAGDPVTAWRAYHAMKARAEQAERERDEALAMLSEIQETGVMVGPTARTPAQALAALCARIAAEFRAELDKHP